jgi:hypothetical protein
MLWLIIGAIWLYCMVRALTFLVALVWVSVTWVLGLMWPGVLWAAGGKLQEPRQQSSSSPSVDWWASTNAQAGESQPAAGYADTQQGAVGDVYRAGDGGPVPGWVRKPGVTIDG